MPKGIYKHKPLSEETKRKISKNNAHFWLGKHFPKETREKIREAMKGKHPSEETKRKISETETGKCVSEETKKRLREANLGKHLSEETKRKISEANKRTYREGRIAWNKGTPLSEKHKKKISESNMGKKNPMSEETKKKLRKVNLGKHLSLETRRKLSEVNKGKKGCWFGKHLSEEHRKKMSRAVSGENNGNWLGGKSFEPYSPGFNKVLKERIRKRDNYTCQECRMTEKGLGYHLICHHIDYNKQNNSSNNLISLCMGCHSQTNFNREDWTKYYQNKIN